jgi:tetrahydromethanopterin S-methyltransferase subunit C
LAPYKNATVFGVIGAALGLMLATFDPLWFDFLGIILVVPVAILGGYVVARKNT